MKRKIIKLSIAFIAIIGLSLGIYFILNAFGLTDIGTLQTFFVNGAWWSIPLFIVLQVMVTTLLCFLPATSMTFTALALLVFGSYSPFAIFAIVFSGIILSSQVMFLIGRYGGQKLAIKLVGKEDIEKAQNLMDSKTKVYLPMMYMLAFFPDDALCFVAGMSKMSFWYHLIIVILFRGIGTATVIALGNQTTLGYLQSQLGDNYVLWALLISVCAFWLLLLLYVGKRLDKWLQRKGDK